MALTVCRQSQTHALPLDRSSRKRLMMALQVHLIYRDVTPSPPPPTYTHFPPPSPLTPSTPPPLQFSHCFPKPQGVHLDSKISGKENNNNKNNTNNRTKRRNTRFLYNLLTAPRTVSNAYAQVARMYSCANHVQHTKHSPRATCCVHCGTKGQFSDDRVEIAFILALFHWLKPLTDKGGKQTEVPGENP